MRWTAQTPLTIALVLTVARDARLHRARRRSTGAGAGCRHVAAGPASPSATADPASAPRVVAGRVWVVAAGAARRPGWALVAAVAAAVLVVVLGRPRLVGLRDRRHPRRHRRRRSPTSCATSARGPTPAGRCASSGSTASGCSPPCRCSPSSPSAGAGGARVRDRRTARRDDRGVAAPAPSAGSARPSSSWRSCRSSSPRCGPWPRLGGDRRQRAAAAADPGRRRRRNHPLLGTWTSASLTRRAADQQPGAAVVRRAGAVRQRRRAVGRASPSA